MNILAIDPGLARCGVVLYDGERHLLHETMVVKPEDALMVANGDARYWMPVMDRLVIEHVGHYGTGQNAGKDVFDTCVLIGQLKHAWNRRCGVKARLILRPDVKTHLCHKRNATDAMVRRALLDRFPATGGGATPQVGTKGQPGPLYGVKGDAWQALALAITQAETVLELPPLRVEVPA